MLQQSISNVHVFIILMSAVTLFILTTILSFSLARGLFTRSSIINKRTSTINIAKMSGFSEKNIINGTVISAQIRTELKVAVDEMKATLKVTPGLAVILVGDRRDSASYVKSKKKACEEIGINSYGIDYPGTVTQEELLQKIDELNLGKLNLLLNIN